MSNEFWAKVELMGHGLTAGLVSRPEEWGGLIRVDVPNDETEDGFITEMYNISAIYAIKPVSEEIARAYAAPARGIIAYDTPIVSREMHEAAIRELRADNYRQAKEVEELRRRLVQVSALPSGNDDEDF